jgi:hypothetical protein
VYLSEYRWVAASRLSKRGDFVTPYEQSIESGKEIVRGILKDLATELQEPKVKELSFKVTDQDFDDRISLMDKQLNIVTKIMNDDLADCLEDVGILRKLEAQLRQAIQAYCEPKQPADFSN